MIRKIEINELPEIYRNHIEKDFPPEERAPYFVIENNMKNNLQEGFIYVKEGIELGYSLNLISEEGVLISLFAVFDGNRGSGIGTEFLIEILKNYKTKKVILVEVEKPELAKKEEEKEVCEKRISFYERLGFSLYKDIDYSIFGTPLYLMAYSREKLTRQEVISYMKKIRGLTLEEKFRNMLKIE